MAKKNKNDNLIKSMDTFFKYSVDMTVVLLSLLAAGCYLNGLSALRVALASSLSALICEDIGCRIFKKDKRTNNLYAFCTGLAVAVMLPATVPAYIAAFGGAFSVIAVLLPFGGARRTPFVPAAAGFAFLSVCFGDRIFTYAVSNPGVSSPLYGSPDFVRGSSFAQMLTYGKSVSLNAIEIINILTGKVSGPLGTTCILALLGVGCYLAFRRKKQMLSSVSFLLTCAVMAVLFPRVNSGALTSVVMELCSGSLLFASLVLLPNPATAPSKTVFSLIYGFLGGIICMLIRYYGAYEEAVCFGILIINAVFPVIEDYYKLFSVRIKEKKANKTPSKGGNAHG